MLRSTFLILPRVGPATETALWAVGCRTWEDYLRGPPRVVRGMSRDLGERHRRILAAAESALAKEPAFFGRAVPTAEHWRAWGELAGDAAFLDIETTGSGQPSTDVSGITVVGVRRRGRMHQLVQGDDLTAENVSALLDGASMLVSFAGASFDVPRLRAAGVRVPTVPHLDLHPALRRLGHKGGLKKVEVALGLAREEDVQGLSGYDAVLLWERHLRGESGALERLLAYNRADVENLEPLARIAYDGLSAAVARGMGRTVPVAART